MSTHRKIPVAVLGATGTVGQRFVQLLADHPWFEVAALAASERSAGRRYAEVCNWVIPGDPPPAIGEMVVRPLEPNLPAELLFSEERETIDRGGRWTSNRGAGARARRLMTPTRLPGGSRRSGVPMMQATETGQSGHATLRWRLDLARDRRVCLQ